MKQGSMFDTTAATDPSGYGLARRTDPATSHRAAVQSARFAGGHKRAILLALRDGALPTNAIAVRAGLTIVQVDRRMHELRKAGLVVRTATDGTFSEYAITDDGRSAVGAPASGA